MLLDRLYALLLEHLVLFLPDQALTPATLLAFAETFGELDTPHHVYPHVPGYERIVLLENDGDRPPNTDVWHTDLTFKQQPPFAAILYANAIPASGGDTLWWSMYAAYDALTDGMKADLRDLSAVHATGSYWNQFFAQGGITRLKEGMAAMGAAVHPIIARHPVTGKPFLYVNRHFTTHVLGLSSGDSQRLLTALFDHINQPQLSGPLALAARDGGAVGQSCYPALCRRRLPAAVSLYASCHGGQRSPEPQAVTEGSCHAVG